MTTDDAGAADFRHGIANGDAPATEAACLGRNKTRLAGGVNIVADFAGASLGRLVDMNIVEVFNTVPKFGLGISALVVGQGIGMAVET